MLRTARASSYVVVPAEMPMVAPGCTSRAASCAIACFSAVISVDFAVNPGSSAAASRRRDRAAVHALEEALAVQPLDVAPHRHVGDPELLDELGDARGAALLDDGEDGGPALAGEHQASRMTAAARAATVVTGPTSVPETRSCPAAASSQGCRRVVEDEEPRAGLRPSPGDLDPGRHLAPRA